MIKENRLKELKIRLETFNEILHDCKNLPLEDQFYFQCQIRKVRAKIKKINKK
jgi:hypothetical protein